MQIPCESIWKAFEEINVAWTQFGKKEDKIATLSILVSEPEESSKEDPSEEDSSDEDPMEDDELLQAQVAPTPPSQHLLSLLFLSNLDKRDHYVARTIFTLTGDV
ncbi:hypothetical protein Tco_0829331 [Tanacetum coccineum]